MATAAHRTATIAEPAALRAGSVLMAVAGLAFIGYAVIFFFRNFTGAFLELGIGPEQVNVGRDEIRALNDDLYRYVSHLHIAVSGFILSTGLATAALAWFRRTAWSAVGVPDGGGRTGPGSCRRIAGALPVGPGHNWSPRPDLSGHGDLRRRRHLGAQATAGVTHGARRRGSMTATSVDTDRGENAVEQLFHAAIRALELLHVYIGDRLGLYIALAEVSDATPAELAVRARIAERYAREWLAEQAVAGWIDVTEKVAETFTAPGDELERFNYGWSALHCLPARAHRAGLGRNRHGHATGDHASLRGCRGVRHDSRVADRARFLAVLPPRPMTIHSHHLIDAASVTRRTLEPLAELGGSGTAHRSTSGTAPSRANIRAHRTEPNQTAPYPIRTRAHCRGRESCWSGGRVSAPPAEPGGRGADLGYADSSAADDGGSSRS
ncbi:hypothetical protein EV643_12590 [Kribbella sp. VKM Ac-2527]|uniref:S-adenosylmethionine-dependent methyltransferase Rv2258c-like winged HTH domain-containing protein n=1 Tax=Kribbella caucasensis TaxID=2512215 RepID=A0A4R6JFS5_9ACTN|nr:hypothetical protein EV643_12590 [Kribbella sp. VKM Ac-2527]